MIGGTTLSVNNAFKETENQLIYYLKGHMQEEIKNRVLELQYPRQPTDDIDIKIQGSMNSISPQERSVTNLMNDRELAVLERRKLTISNFLSNLSQREYEILSQYYLKRKEWRDVAYAVNYSERHTRRIRDKLIIQLTGLLGWSY